MSNYAILYNPLAGSPNDESFKDELAKALDGTLAYYDVTKIEDVVGFINDAKEENIVITGGDGTLNRFVNEVYGIKTSKKLYYYAAGSGNDFWHDCGKVKGDKPVELNKYLESLPTVTVKGKEYKFINGVGYGIDGYCCEVGDKLKAEGKDVDYTGIAIKGLLFHFKPKKATIIVDGETSTFNNVWIAPTMIGKYYGGGMIPTPDQDRFSENKTVSTCIFYGKGRLATLMVFPKIFKGEHVKNTKRVKILSGHEITVKFDSPCALQVDGETVKDVSEYTVKY